MQSYFDRESLSAEVGKAPVANSLNTILHRIPAGSRSSGLGRAKRTPKVPLEAAAAGANTVTVTFNTATPYVDIRATEYSGLDPINPLDATA